MKAQGATEYLVLLAVVLIVALVSVALLGFFPGMAQDAQITQSQSYWQSASPIAIIESAARASSATPAYSVPYLRVRNTGAYPLRITQVLGNGQNISMLWFGGVKNISDYFYLAPGEEAYFGYGSTGAFTVPADRGIVLQLGNSGSSDRFLVAASSACQNSTTAPGILLVNGFGFEYISYVEGQQTTKRFISSKPLIIKCREPY
jgi:hypothetical protein